MIRISTIYKRTLHRCRTYGSAACCSLRGPVGCPYIARVPYMYVGVIGVGDMEKNRPRKTESVFLFRFYGATEKPTKKRQFSIGKNRGKPTETTHKVYFRLSVHNPECGATLVISNQRLYCWFLHALMQILLFTVLLLRIDMTAKATCRNFFYLVPRLYHMHNSAFCSFVTTEPLVSL